MTEAKSALDPEFLQMLVCPATRKPLRRIVEAELNELNGLIAGGGVCNRAGESVSEPFADGLCVEDDGSVWVFPIQDGIPILLSGEAVQLSGGSSAGGKG
jgi:uncharacterized protein YbaR (Trm112 family)